MNMATSKVYVDKRRKRKDGSYPVKITVTVNGKSFHINTGLFTKADLQNYRFGKDDPNYRIKNIRLNQILVDTEKKLVSSQINKLTFEETRNLFRDKKKSYMLSSIIDEILSKKNSKSTIYIYSMAKNYVIEYGDIDINEANAKWANGIYEHLISRMKINSAKTVFSKIKAAFNYSINHEYTTNYPFRNIKIKSEQTKKRSLTVDEIRKIRDFKEGNLSVYSDIFMLQFYLIGINFKDLIDLDFDTLRGNNICYVRHKTGKLYEFIIQPEAKLILSKTVDKIKGLNILRYNNKLDLIGKKLGFKFKLTSYWSRHTWATIASYLDIPKSTISECLGHSYGASVTDVYINYDKKKIDKANRMVIDYVNSDIIQAL